jgi:phosphate transport system permease protein
MKKKDLSPINTTLNERENSKSFNGYKIRRSFSNIMFKYFCLFSGSILFITLFSIIYFVGKTGVLVFKEVPLLTFFFSTNWTPEEQHFGAAAIIIGTLVLTGVTLLIATPISLAVAIFLSEIAPNFLKRIMRPMIGLLVGIPSVVYGYFGLTVLIPFIRRITGTEMGDGILVAALVLSLMVFPTITSISDDALTFLPNEYREASYALGSTRLQMIWKVLLPGAKEGIITAIILGMARAIGETMAVVMVIGNVAQLPKTLLTPTSVLTSNIVMQIMNVEADSTWSNALYMMAFLLLLISLILIACIRFIRNKGEQTL